MNNVSINLITCVNFIEEIDPKNHIVATFHVVAAVQIIGVPFEVSIHDSTMDFFILFLA
jgi:hypothetical protein